jgi:hypothetical protein
MREAKEDYHPEWKPDCQGKWDYDCDLVSLSCRYWPQGGGFHVYDTMNGSWEGNEVRPGIRPSAKASICIGDLAIGPYEELAEVKFDGDTEDEVKAKIEAWAAEMIGRVDAAIRREFETPND